MIRLYQQGMEALNYGRYQEALAYFERSLKIGRSFNYVELISASLHNIGMVYIRLKDYARAEELFKEAEKKEKSIGLKWSINPGMAELYLATKRYDDTLRMLEKSTPSLSSVPDYQIQYFTQRGSAFKGNKRLKEASGDFLKAAILIEDMRAGIKGEKSGIRDRHYYNV